jgi:Transposase, Mutator family
MKAEVSSRIGAELGERSPERTTHRNGYGPASGDPRVGSLELAIPKLRTGSYFPSFLEPRRRAEQALVAVVQEAYVNGVSTREVDGWSSSSACATWARTRSRGCAAAWTSRSGSSASDLGRCYLYLWVDAKVERVREPGGVRHKALVIAYGVHQSGRREVIDLDVGGRDRGVLRQFLRSLRERGLGACGCASPTPTPASRRPSARCWALRGSAAPSISCATCSATSAAPAAGGLGRYPRDHHRHRGSARSSSSSKRTRPRSPGWRMPRPSCWPSTPSPPSTSPSSGAPTPRSGSTARSAAAPTWSASSPMTPRCCGLAACSCSSRTMRCFLYVSGVARQRNPVGGGWFFAGGWA